jgi:transposase
MRQSRTLSGGLDVHQDSMAVASVATDHHAEGVYLGTIGTRQCAIAPRSRTLHSKAPHLIFVDDAGPWGYWLYRYLTPKGRVCGVVAPALMPQQAGDRAKTDRRDAGPLARRMRAGELTRGSGPTVEDEALRDLSRARAAALRDRKAAQVRRNACLLRPDRRSTGRAPGRPAPLRWRSAGVCATPAPQRVCHDDVRAVTEQPARRQRREPARQDQVHTWRRRPVLEARPAGRGVPGTVAAPLVAARGDLPRGEPPRHLRPERGWLPSDSRAPATGSRP